MDLEPAVQGNAQHWEPRFVPREIVPETVRCLSRRTSILSRKPTRLKQALAGHMQHFLPVLSGGAHTDAMSGGIKAAATTQPAEQEGQKRADG